MVGLDDVLDFQKFLLDTQGWPVTGERHRLVVREKSDISAFLKLLANFGKVCIHSGSTKSSHFVAVDDFTDYLALWGSDTESDYGPETTLALVPDYLKIVAGSDPRNSYAKLVNNPLARLPEKAFKQEAFNPVLFYPAHSLVPVVMSGEPRFLNANDKSDFFMAIDKRMDALFRYIGKRYPVTEVLHKSSSMEDSLVYAFNILTASRPHENKRENVITQWLYENIPFPVEVMHQICRQTSAGTNIRYTIEFKLPE